MMAAANPISDSISAVSSSLESGGAALLVFLAPMPAEQVESVLGKLSISFHPKELLIAVPDGIQTDAYPALRIVHTPATKLSLTLTATNFLNAYQLAEKNNLRAILILGQESGSLRTPALRELADAVLAHNTDLAIPCYDLPPRAGLVNSAIIFPLTRALFASQARFPLAIDLGLSLRMAQRLAAVAQRFTSLNESEALIWPVNEAIVAGFTISELNVGPRALPQPIDPDINSILTFVTGSLFSDIEAKAASWQRARPFPPFHPSMQHLPSTDAVADITSMLDAFRLAYTNFQEIWGLVLPPNSLLGIKRLYMADSMTFRMPDSLWVRIVFDFLIAYRLRTIHRGHLLGALIPLYFAWVASHINLTASGTDAESHIEAVAVAFETDKPYLVGRWRWPDRFNP